MPIARYNEFVSAFLASFNKVALALGGEELVLAVQTEIEYEISEGASITEAISKVYDATKSRYGL